MQSFKLYFLVLLLVFIQSILFAQSCEFKIMKGDSQLGTISAIKKTTGKQVSYYVSSKASFRVVFKYLRETFTDVTFSNGVMQSAVLKQTMNKELKDHKVTTKNDLGYNCQNKIEETEHRISKLITFCSSMLFFQEPRGVKYVFTETHQELSPIKEIEKGIYKLTLPDGKVNHYVYKSGVLQEVRVFRSMVDLVFKRQ